MMGKSQHQCTYQDNDLVFKLVTIGDYGVGKSRLYLRYAENRFPDEIKTCLAIDFVTHFGNPRGYSAKIGNDTKIFGCLLQNAMMMTANGRHPTFLERHPSCSNIPALYYIKLLFPEVCRSSLDTCCHNVSTAEKTRRIALDGKQITLRLFDTFGEERFRLPTRSYYRGSHGVLLVFDLTNEVSFNRVDFWMKQVKEYGDDNAVKVLVGAKADLAEKRTVSFETAKAYADQNGMLYCETSAKTAANVEELFMTLATEIKQRVGDGKLNAEPSTILMPWRQPESGWTCGC